jgi:hypothetical protein
VSPITAYYWRGVPNFGDLLSPLLLKHFCGIDAEWAQAEEADIACTGSIVEHLGQFQGTVIGSGRMYGDAKRALRNATVLALRGPLTAKGISTDCALGDPGLLADELVMVETRKHALGIVPHWSDRTLATDARFMRYHPLVIDPRADPLEVVRQIGSCRKIVTSSLHGMIVADAFGIPRRFEYTPQFDREGGMFKFLDHSAAVNTPLEVGVTMVANRFAVHDRKSELADAFRELC